MQGTVYLHYTTLFTLESKATLKKRMWLPWHEGEVQRKERVGQADITTASCSYTCLFILNLKLSELGVCDLLLELCLVSIKSRMFIVSGCRRMNSWIIHLKVSVPTLQRSVAFSLQSLSSAEIGVPSSCQIATIDIVMWFEQRTIVCSRLLEDSFIVCLLCFCETNDEELRWSSVSSIVFMAETHLLQVKHEDIAKGASKHTRPVTTTRCPSSWTDNQLLISANASLAAFWSSAVHHCWTPQCSLLCKDIKAIHVSSWSAYIY